MNKFNICFTAFALIAVAGCYKPANATPVEAPLIIHNDKDATVSIGIGGSIRGPVIIYNKNRIIFSVPAGSTISNKSSSSTR